MKTKNTAYWIIGFVTLTVIGFLIIPAFIRKFSNKFYKSSLKNEEIDFENLGPEIVKKDEAKEE